MFGPLERVQHGLSRHHLGPDHDHHAVRQGREHQRLGDGADGRRIDHDPVVGLAKPVQQGLKRLRGHEVGGAGDARPRRDDVERRPLDASQRRRGLPVFDEEVGEPWALVDPQQLMDSRLAQVGVEEHDLSAPGRERERQIHRRERLALAR